MKRPRGVDAVPSPAETLEPLAFIHVHANLHQGRDLEAGVTLTGEGAWHVHAGSVATDAPHDVALIDVHALHAVLVQGVSVLKKIEKMS